MAVRLSTTGLLLPVILLVAMAGMYSPASAAAEDFADIWKEGLDVPGQPDLSPERLDQVIKYVAKDDARRDKQLHEMYEKDRDKFWSEIRAFFHKEREARGPEGGAGNGPGGPPSGRGRYRDQLQRRHDELMEWLKMNFPEVEKELASLRNRDDDEEYAKRFSDIRRIYEPIMSTESRNPELGGVLKEDRLLSMRRDAILKDIRRYGRDRNKKERLINDLGRIVEQRFDLIVRKKQLQFEELRERLEQLQRELEARETELGKLVKSKDAATKSRVEALLDPKAKVDWE